MLPLSLTTCYFASERRIYGRWCDGVISGGDRTAEDTFGSRDRLQLYQSAKACHVGYSGRSSRKNRD